MLGTVVLVAMMAMSPSCCAGAGVRRVCAPRFEAKAPIAPIHPSSLLPLAIARQAHMRMLLGLSQALPSLVEAKFRSAKAASSLVFSPTELAIIRTSTGIPVRGATPSSPCSPGFANTVTVPVTILPCPSKETDASERAARDAEEAIRPFRQPSGRPPHRRHTEHEPDPPAGAQQVPNYCRTLHPCYKVE